MENHDEIEVPQGVHTVDSPEEGNLVIPEELSLLTLRDMVLFPNMVVPLHSPKQSAVQLIDDLAVAGNRIVGLVTQKNPEIQDPSFEDIYSVGVAGIIRMMLKMPDGVRLMIQTIARIEVMEPLQTRPYLKARIRVVFEPPMQPEEAIEVEAVKRNIVQLFQQMVAMSPNLPDELQAIPLNVSDPGVLADLIAAHSPLPTSEKEAILEEFPVRSRLKRLHSILSREIQVLELGSKIQSEVNSEVGKAQREYYLREQMKAIQRELGEGDEHMREIEELRQKIAEAGMPQEAEKEAYRELERLARMSSAAPEYTVARTYIDWLVAIPWAKSTQDNLDIAEVRRILDEDHYGLEKVKERILEYLSVKKFKTEGTMRHPILCFVGPPGVGKTSLGKSIARALGRNFVRMSLGGVRDEAEIRGHRRTYIGALPGQIIQGIRRAGSNNPIFMLDEIDKVGADFRGDPSSALLEVLDPEQNSTFRDHYLEVVFDLSKVMFITTANMLDTILPPLRDRMEILEISGYTEEEKTEIALRHLIPKQLREHGLQEGVHIEWTPEAIQEIIRSYTREAGVRNLEREIASVCRKVTRQFAEGRPEKVVVDKEIVSAYLGVPRFQFEEILDRASQPGVAIGLAWTPVGGDVLFVEATAMPGDPGLTLTGQLGEVMKESAQAALSYVRTHSQELGVSDDFFRKHSIHLHVPAGAIPKDGPSAGVTMVTALASLATNRPVKRALAMTGEITLTGRVLPIGGVKEKVLAARRAGIKTVILPIQNRKDLLEDIPEEIRGEMAFHFVKDALDLLGLALEPACRESPGEERPLAAATKASPPDGDWEI